MFTSSSSGRGTKLSRNSFSPSEDNTDCLRKREAEAQRERAADGLEWGAGGLRAMPSS